MLGDWRTPKRKKETIREVLRDDAVRRVMLERVSFNEKMQRVEGGHNVGRRCWWREAQDTTGERQRR